MVTHHHSALLHHATIARSASPALVVVAAVSAVAWFAVAAPVPAIVLIVVGTAFTPPSPTWPAAIVPAAASIGRLRRRGCVVGLGLLRDGQGGNGGGERCRNGPESWF